MNDEYRKSLADMMIASGKFDEIDAMRYGIVFSTKADAFGIGRNRMMLDNNGHLFSLDSGWAQELWIARSAERTLSGLVSLIESF